MFDVGSGAGSPSPAPSLADPPGAGIGRRGEADIRQDVNRLWLAVFGQPPVLASEPALMLACLVEAIACPPYLAGLSRPGQPALEPGPPENG